MEIVGTLKRVIKKSRGNNEIALAHIETLENPMYPQILEIEGYADKASLFDGITEGSEINVSINLRGREWTSPQGELKVFNTLSAWKVTVVNSQSQSAPAQSPPAAAPSSDLDDLPF